MTIQDKVRERLEALITEGDYLRRGDSDGYAREVSAMQKCSAWLTAAQHLIHAIVPTVGSPYRFKADMLAVVHRSVSINHTVGELVEVLKGLKHDVDAGLVSSIVESAQSEVFDEFLDHAEEYARRDRKQEAAVIAGVVFEDTIRRMCTRAGISEAGVNLDRLISALASGNVISGIKAKRARGTAALRTSATHAQWDEFQIDDVKAAIQMSRELIAEHLDGP